MRYVRMIFYENSSQHSSFLSYAVSSSNCPLSQHGQHSASKSCCSKDFLHSSSSSLFQKVCFACLLKLIDHVTVVSYSSFCTSLKSIFFTLRFDQVLWYFYFGLLNWNCPFRIFFFLEHQFPLQQRTCHKNSLPFFLEFPYRLLE